MGNLFDSANYPDNEPEKLVIGDRWAWKRGNLTDYPPATYGLSYELRLEGNGATTIAIAATGSGSDFIVEVASATTAAYTAGSYRWHAYITRTADSERIKIDEGVLVIAADFAVSTADPRTHAKIVLDAIEAVIENRATKDQQSYSIAGRSLARTPMADLLKLRQTYRNEVENEKRAERIANGLGHSGNIRVRF